MMKKFTCGAGYALFLIFYLNSLTLLGEGFSGVAGARQAGMGKCPAALSGFWCVSNNPAGMAVIQQYGFGISYENPYNIPGLGIKQVGAAVPLKSGVLGLALTHFGNSLYGEMKTGLSYAMSFGDHFRAGVRLDYLLLSLGNGYGSRSAITFDAGIQVHLTGQVVLGIWVFNPINVRLSRETGFRLPVVVRMGFVWAVSEKLVAVCEVEKNSAFHKIVIRAGAEYLLPGGFAARCGSSTGGEMFSLGFGWLKGLFRLDIAGAMNQALGISSQLSFILNFRRR